MIANLARERQKVFVEMKEMEKHILSPVGMEGIIGVLAWSVCDHEGRRRFVAVDREDDAGGKYETVRDDACKTGGRVPRNSAISTNT